MRQFACISVLLLAILAFGCSSPRPGVAGGPAEGLKPAPFEALITVHGLETYDLEMGKRVYEKACMACHSMGVAAAPRFGQPEDWRGRTEKGMETLISNAIEGYQGEKGFMPARGGRPELTDEEVAAGVAYMVGGSR